MHVGLRIVLDAPVEVVRDALRSPQVMVAVTEPLLVYRSRDPRGFPPHWTPGEPHPIAADVFGVLPAGDTWVDLDAYDVDGVPVQRDNGGGESGLFGLMTMRHRMAATAIDDEHTLLRDRLTYRMRPAVLGLLLWPGLWVTWQWRAARMRALAPSWR
jgi:ligand-binding SRPBCC domain-containing protein